MEQYQTEINSLIRINWKRRQSKVLSFGSTLNKIPRELFNKRTQTNCDHHLSMVICSSTHNLILSWNGSSVDHLGRMREEWEILEFFGILHLNFIHWIMCRLDVIIKTFANKWDAVSEMIRLRRLRLNFALNQAKNISLGNYFRKFFKILGFEPFLNYKTFRFH